MDGPDPVKQGQTAEKNDEKPEAADWYSTKIQATGIPTGTIWVWDYTTVGQDILPDPLGLVFDKTGSSPSIGTSETTIIGSPKWGSSTAVANGIYKITPILREKATTIIEPAYTANPNFTVDIKSLNEGGQYTIKIWERTYLEVNIPNARQTGFVTREGENIDFDKAIADGEDHWYRPRRAVIPGQQGVVSTGLTNVGFVRWEVEQDNSREVEIGRQISPTAELSNGVKLSGWWLTANDSFARITMPPLSRAENAQQNNVTIRGVHPESVPRILWEDPGGRVGNFYMGSLRFTNPTGGSPPNRNDGDIGIYGPVPASWQQPFPSWEIIEGVDDPADITGTSKLAAPGLNIPMPPFDSTSVAGTPTHEGTYNFRVRVTLPGKMQLDLPMDGSYYTVVIEPPRGLIVGDVNRDRAVNLADLIMMARFFSDSLSEAELALFDLDAADIKYEGTRPNSTDFRNLRDWFTNPDITSDFEYPIGSDRPRRP